LSSSKKEIHHLSPHPFIRKSNLTFKKSGGRRCLWDCRTSQNQVDFTLWQEEGFGKRHKLLDKLFEPNDFHLFIYSAIDSREISTHPEFRCQALDFFVSDALHSSRDGYVLSPPIY